MIEFYYQLLDVFKYTYTGRIVYNFFQLIVLIGPYFIISVIINAIIRSYLINKNWTGSSKNEFLSLLSGGLIGIVSPLPTYLAVPMGISLLDSGIPISAMTAFIVASPLMNPGIFYLTWSQLGAEIAIARVISTFGIAVGAGMIAKILSTKFRDPAFPEIKNKKQIRHPLGYEIKRSIMFLGKFFVLSLFLAALVRALVPVEFISRIVGANANMSLIVAIVLGVPFYSCGGAAIPLVKILSEMGMNKGAVLAFFIAGPATKLETMYVYKSIWGLRIYLLYLGIILIGAFFCGLILLKIC